VGPKVVLDAVGSREPVALANNQTWIARSSSPYPSQYVYLAIPTLGIHERLKKKLNSVAVVRKRTIPTERPLLVGEVANLCG
jgi:hypothetical protein